MRTINLVILPGDGIGPEIMEVAKKILNKLKKIGFFDLRIEDPCWWCIYKRFRFYN